MTSHTHTYSISESAIKNFVPTWLYIKRHSITGMLYFGKTVSKDVNKYKGSGTLWLRIIKKHGKEHVETLWSELFTDIHEMSEFATSFSIAMNIIESDCWANLIIENGLNGGIVGLKHSKDAIEKMSKVATGKKRSEESKRNMSKAGLGRKLSEETKMKMASSKTGVKQSEQSIKKRVLSNTGKKRSEESKRNMSKAGLGRTHWNDGIRNYRIRVGAHPDPNWFRGDIKNRR
jgi:hypothetical protein